MSTFDDIKRRTWAGRAQAYSETFAHLCAHTGPRILDEVAVRPGVHLLDVGTGAGTVAALGLGRGADVTAVDPDPGMCGLTRIAAVGARVCQAALPHLPFADDTFDAVTANFVLNMVGDPRAATIELGRVCRPGARVGVSVWPRPITPLHQLWEDVLDAAGLAESASTPGMSADLDFARTTAGVADLLRSAGLADVRVSTVEFLHDVDPVTWWSGPARGVASIGAVVIAQDPDMVAVLEREYRRLSARYLGPDGLLHLPASALVASGRSAG